MFVVGKGFYKFVLLILGAAAGYVLAYFVLWGFYAVTLSDFAVYYNVTDSVLNLSRPEHPYINYVPMPPFIYPPAFLILFWPLTLFAFSWAKYVFVVFNVGLIVGGLYLINHAFDKRLTYKFWVMLVLAAFFYPLQFTLKEGQFNIVIFFIFAYALWALLNKRDISGGVAIGLGALIKISPMIILVLALLRKRWRFIFACLSIIFIFSAAAEIFIDRGINYYYGRHVVVNIAGQSPGASYRDQSIQSLIKSFEISVPELSIGGINIKEEYVVSAVSYGLAGVLFLAFLILDRRGRKNKEDLIISYSILVMIGVLGTGLTWFHHFTIILLPLFVFLFVSIDAGGILRKVGIVISVLSYLLMFYNFEQAESRLGAFNLLVGSLSILAGLFVLKYYAGFKGLKEERLRFKLGKRFTILMVMVFSVFMVLGLRPWDISEHLKFGRDRARVRNINYMGGVLQNRVPLLKEGMSNSVERSRKLDEGYILFDNSHGEVMDRLAILLLDPINDGEYKFEFLSEGGTDFVLRARLESDKMRTAIGEYYEFRCVERQCTKPARVN